MDRYIERTDGQTYIQTDTYRGQMDRHIERTDGQTHIEDRWTDI